MNYFPKISIVTPSFNQGDFLEETILSVLNQNYPNLEFIIIDGGSNDNSVSIIKKYESYLKYWVSEKDLGQANAINKGLSFCEGEIFNWLNSDDYLEPGALIKIAEAFSDSNVDIVTGKVRFFSTTFSEIIANENLSAKGLMCWSPGVKFAQPGAWMRLNLMMRCGGIDENYHYSFDWDLYIRYLYLYSNIKKINELLVNFRLHDKSKTQTSNILFAEEERKIIEKIYFSSEYNALKDTCLYKIQKTNWTKFLSEQSRMSDSFYKKTLKVLLRLQEFKKVSYSFQTLGAIKAYWNKKIF